MKKETYFAEASSIVALAVTGTVGHAQGGIRDVPTHELAEPRALDGD